MSGSAKCYVGGLSWNTNDDMLREVFEKFGALVECKVIMDRDDPTRSKGFAFVTFEEARDAQDAVDKLVDFSLDNRTIRVQIAMDKGPRGGGGGGGGFRSDRGGGDRGRGGYDRNGGGGGGDRRGGGDRYGGGERRSYGGDRRDGGNGQGGGYRDRREGGGGGGEQERRRDRSPAAHRD